MWRSQLSYSKEQLAGIGQGALTRGALEEGLADFVFEAADGVADGGLGAV